MRPSSILMVGTSMSTPGGMTAVVRSYRAGGLFDRCAVEYVGSYEGKGALRQLRVMLTALGKVLGRLLRGECAALHVHSASRGSFWRKSVFCVLARMARVPYLFHLHSGEFPVFYHRECGRLAQAWVKRTLRGAARVLVLTDRWRSALLEIEPKLKLEVLGNPVSVPEHLSPLKDLVGEVLFLGRLREKKGVFDLVRAMPAILAAHPGMRFVLAGDGELEVVRVMARELKVEHALDMPGWIDGDEKDKAIGHADIFVLPSYFEGLPVGILEAMAAGVPIVATTVGGIPDILQDGKNALLVQPGQVNALADAIIRLAEDKALRNKLREAAYEGVRAHYSEKVVLEKLEVLYWETVPACSKKTGKRGDE